MKKNYIPVIVTICMTMLSIVNAKAQINDSWALRRIYLTGSTGKDAYLVQLNVHFKNRWMAFVSWEDGNIKGKNRPDNYNPGNFGALFGGIGYARKAMDFDEYAPFTLGAGRIITGPSDRAWITAIGGIVVGKYSERLFTPHVPDTTSIFYGSGWGSSSNYDTQLEGKTMLGIKVGLQCNVNLARYIGIASGIQALVTNQKVIPNYTLGLNLGLMRPGRANMIK